MKMTPTQYQYHLGHLDQLKTAYIITCETCLLAGISLNEVKDKLSSYNKDIVTVRNILKEAEILDNKPTRY